jgi:cytochrome c biogenesis protein CcdA
MTDFTIGYILSLAFLDAINPCALAVIAMVLMKLLLKDPANKKQVLFGGLFFTIAVFILYFIYGILMVVFFSSALPETGNFANYVFKGFGMFAIILGLFNLKDFLKYNPGGFMTEMPLFLRPRVKSIIGKINSSIGAFIIGLFVTLFLLPCTIGPYIIASGKLSSLNFLSTLPWLFVYNLVFILPMLGITFLIYLGVTTVENISGWKENNIRYLHLIEGIILMILGILMFTGII